MLAHCPIDDICLPVFFLEDHIGNKCTIVCFNVSISSVNIMYMRISIFAYALYTNSFICMYYNVLPNKLTHSLTQIHTVFRLQKDVLAAEQKTEWSCIY